MSTNLKPKLAGFITHQAGEEQRSLAQMLDLVIQAGVRALYGERALEWLKEQQEGKGFKKGVTDRPTLPLFYHDNPIRSGGVPAIRISTGKSLSK